MSNDDRSVLLLYWMLLQNFWFLQRQFQYVVQLVGGALGQSALHSVAYILFYIQEAGLRTLWRNCFPVRLSGKINRPRLVNVFGILSCLSWFRFDFYWCYSLFELKVLISMNMSNSAVYLPSRRQCRRKTPVLPPFPLYIHRLSSTKPRQSSRRTMPWRLIIGENQQSSSVPQGSPQQPSKSSR